MAKAPLSPSEGFTLLELIISMAIIAVLSLVLIGVTNQAAATLHYTTGKIEQFREARTAFDAMSSRISQATLNTYFDYFDNSTPPQQRTPANSATFVPARYGRASELRFLSGQANDGSAAAIGNFTDAQNATAQRITHCVFFHAPLGVVDSTQVSSGNTNYHGFDNVLNAWGYYVEFRDDAATRPPIFTAAFPPPRFRFRLMEFRQPSQALEIYQDIARGNAAPYSWYQNNVNANGAPVHVLAENIIALIVHPQLAQEDINYLQQQGASTTELTSDYRYDTTQSNPNPVFNPKNQLPPVLQIAMVAIDEASAARLNLNANSTNIFGLVWKAPASGAAKFTSTSNYESDLYYQNPASPGTVNMNSLEKTLINLHLNYRIFTANVSIRGAKWSRSQNF